MLMLPFFLIIFSGVILLGTIGSAFSNVTRGGVSTYDEYKFQDYADQQYAVEFGATKDYEDNLLIVFLVEDEEYYDYAFIAWVGDHVNTKISNMFGNEQTGLPAHFASLGQSVVIPQTNEIDSLNLAVAVSIGTYAFTRPIR